MSDPIRPNHHRALMPTELCTPHTLEAIDVIEAWRLNFHLGNAIKYILRAGRKPDTHFSTDIEKAVWYLQRELSRPWTEEESWAESERVGKTPYDA